MVPSWREHGSLLSCRTVHFVAVRTQADMGDLSRRQFIGAAPVVLGAAALSQLVREERTLRVTKQSPRKSGAMALWSVPKA